MCNVCCFAGGGKPSNPPPGPFQGQVEALLGPTLDGMKNSYDSDAKFSCLNADNVMIMPLTKNILSEVSIAF